MNAQTHPSWIAATLGAAMFVAAAPVNVAKPDFRAKWQIRAQAQLMFPK